MRLLVRSALLLTLALPMAAAAPPFFGEPFPLTNTRYGTPTGIPTLATNGNTLVLAWVADQSVRVARVVDGQRTTSSFVLPTYGSQDEVAITWTGSHFLVAATSQIDDLPVIMGRLLNTNGLPTGEPFPIVLNATEPRLASTPARTMLLYRDATAGDLYARALQGDGTATPGRFPEKVTSRSAFGPLYDIATNGSGFMAITSTPEEVKIVRFDGNGVRQSTRVLSSSQGTARPRPATIATDGAGYLVAWLDFSRLGYATFVDADGNSLSPVVFDEIINSPTPLFLAPKAVWSGTDWIVSYVHKVQLAQRLRTVHFDASVRNVTQRETEMPIATGALGTSSLVRHQGKVNASWSADRFPTENGLVVSTLPLANGSGKFVTYDPFDQVLLAATGTSSLSVFVWTESNDRDSVIHVATADLGGFHLEREIPVVAQSAVAAAGQGFLIVTRDGPTSTAILLDENGTPFGKQLDVPFVATSVAWNGAVWAVAGELDGAVVVAEVTPDGVVSAPKLVRNQAESPRIASKGDEFLMVWLAEGSCSAPCFPPTIVRGARLDPERNRIDGFDLDFAPSLHAESPAVAWNPDSEVYIVAWIDVEEIVLRQVPPDDVLPPGNSTLHVGLGRQKDLSALTAAGTVALTWNDEGQTRVAFLNVIAQIAKMFVFPHDEGHSAGFSLLTEVPEGDTAVLFTELMEEAPYYGAMRLKIALSSPISVGVPDTPSITARLENGQMQLAWTTPDKVVNGFRFEYRVGDGAWLEFEEFFDRTIRGTTFAPLNREPHSFRIRAYSDDDVSEYSNVATVLFPIEPKDGKRRSVRK